MKAWNVPVYQNRSEQLDAGSLTGKVSVDDMVLILDTDWDEAYVMCKVGVKEMHSLHFRRWVSWEVLRDNDR